MLLLLVFMDGLRFKQLLKEAISPIPSAGFTPDELSRGTTSQLDKGRYGTNSQSHLLPPSTS